MVRYLFVPGEPRRYAAKQMPKINLSSTTLSSLPNAEDDTFEFKCSGTPIKDLKKKLDRAASGFANSGGGCFLFGLDDSGNADGGVSTKVGRQDLRDWIDQAISSVSPVPEYDVRLYDDCEGRGQLDTDNVIAAVSIFPSESGPHQASDHKYYIRAGAHTVSASHFIVEALWARRHVQKPVLVHVVRAKPNATSIVQVGVVAVTDAPALNVEFTLSPLSGTLKKLDDYFPVKLPVVDKNNPFFLDASVMHMAEKELGDHVKVIIKYHDHAGTKFSHSNDAPLTRSISPITMGTVSPEKIAKALEKLEGPLKQIARNH